MKKLLFAFLLANLLFITVSCDEEIGPNSDFVGTYSLNCIMGNDTASQVATIYKNYFIENRDPLTNTIDPAVKGADIRISFMDSAKIFQEGTIERPESFRYDSPATFYFVDNLNLVPDTEYIIEAQLPNGKRLRGRTKTPVEVIFNAAQSDTIIPPHGKDFVSVNWEIPTADLYVAPVFTLVYLKNENGLDVRYTKRVPAKYIEKNGNLVPLFPEPSYLPTIIVEMDAFDRALEEISEGDPNKGNYTILAFILEVRVYDENLTSYYASINEVPANFTLNLNMSDFSNIEGGLGIFGSYLKQRYAIRFSHDYIRLFGYVPGLTE